MTALSLVDLVRNGTMSAEIAGTLATAAAERRSLLFIAIPRHAGKSTTMQATLAYAPEGTPQHHLTRDAGPSLGIPEEADGGYLVVAEVSEAGFANYLWGEPARQAFAALRRGFSMATALHAPGVEEAFEVLCGQNRVPDDDAGRIELAVYIRSLGSDWRNPTGRRIADVYEVERVDGGRPRGRRLHRWDEGADRFEAVERAALIGSGSAGGIEERVAEIAHLAEADVEAAE
jgi:hypothetical protein